MTKHGETDGYRASDFVREIYDYSAGRCIVLFCMMRFSLTIS